MRGNISDYRRNTLNAYRNKKRSYSNSNNNSKSQAQTFSVMIKSKIVVVVKLDVTLCMKFILKSKMTLLKTMSV